jgi:nitroreductase
MLYELLKSRRSIRKYQSREIEKEKIDTILKSALLAPSSRARRPWEFIAVTDKAALQKLSECREHGSQHIAGAPLCIAVAADPDLCDVWTEDASIASTIIQLSAQTLGLGSCWIQIRERFGANQVKSGDIVKQTLGIPDKYEIECLIAIGYPAEEKKRYEESDLKYEKLHFERW